MLSFYAAKGGVGCSVVAAATACLSSRTQSTLLVDLHGDLASVLGLTVHGPGLADWFGADAALPDSLSRLEVAVHDRLSLLPLGGEPTAMDSERLELLARLLRLEGRQVLVDVGTLGQTAAAIVGASHHTVLVTRACYLALRAADALVPPDEVVIISEPGRALRASDVAAACGVKAATELRWDPAVARSVDAGLLAARMPRSLLSLRTLL